MVNDLEKTPKISRRLLADPVPGFLVWNEEFDGSGVDPDRWTFETGTGTDGWGNQEWEYYRAENAEVRDFPGGGRGLVLTARVEPAGNRMHTSARLKTQDKFTFTYGRIEARIRLPSGKGLWPAFWLLGASFPEIGWPRCGEVDILEMVGGAGVPDRTVHGTAHWDEGGHRYLGGKTVLARPLSEEFHVYSLDWTPEALTWAVDGQDYQVQPITEPRFEAFHRPFFLLLNLAVGGVWPGYPDEATLFPQEMWVDWIRIYENQ